MLPLDNSMCARTDCDRAATCDRFQTPIELKARAIAGCLPSQMAIARLWYNDFCPRECAYYAPKTYQ